jgi:hypothetical protein
MALIVSVLPAQPPARVEFSRDVLTLLRQNCVQCHGASQQNGGLRLDRRSSAIQGGIRRIVPGSSANSFLYHRLTGSEFGMQMPPTGPLKRDQIDVIKAWIDQGADWPDAFANEAERPPAHPSAVAMVDALRRGDLSAFMTLVAGNPKLLNARGPEGSTPFMYAVLYCDAATLTRLLKQGADPNKGNDADATALMWAASDLEKTRLLLNHGANANARSNDLRTPLMIAARRYGGVETVKLLLEHGANPNPNRNPVGESSPVLHGKSSVRPANSRGARRGRRVQARGSVPARYPTGRRLVVRENAGIGLPAVFRCRVPVRFRSVDLDGRHHLGYHGPDACGASASSHIGRRGPIGGEHAGG